MKVNWITIAMAPDKEVWVYQPAIIYASGEKYNHYITKASRCGDHWYSDEFNVMLKPTHFADFEIEPPDNLVIQLGVDGPRRYLNVTSG